MTKKRKIETAQAPKAIGPYSQAISIPANQRLVFVSGQLPIDPSTNEMALGNIKVLTRQVLDNISAILIEAGSSLENVVRVDIFLKDIKRDFAMVNEEYEKYFSSGMPPARQTIQVSDLPKGALIEISCIAMSDQA